MNMPTSTGRWGLLRYEARVGVGLSSLVLLLACAAPALGVTSDPPARPEKLWNEFPLNPTGDRLETTKPQDAQPPRRQPRQDSTSPAPNQAAEETSPTPSDADAIVPLVAAALLVLLAAVGLVSVYVRQADYQTVRHADHQTERTLSLRQWASPSAAGPGLVERRKPPLAGVPVSGSRRGYGARRHSPVLAATDGLRRSYRRRSLYGSRVRGHAALRESSRPSVGRVATRLKRALWTEDTIPIYLGSAAAIVLATLIVQWVG